MNVGDLVIRRVRTGSELSYINEATRTAIEQRDRLGHGIVLSKQMAGRPRHKCVSVFYPKAGKIYDIAESLMEVISETTCPRN